MANISQMTFSDASAWMQILYFDSNFTDNPNGPIGAKDN